MVGDRGEPFEVLARDRLVSHLQREVGDDRREVAVPGALAVPVDRPLHLDRAAAHAGERVRHTGSRVVVQVHRDPDIGSEVLDDLADHPLHVVRQRTAVGVAEHETRRARGCGGFEHAQRELGSARVAVEEVLGVEQHVEAGGAQEGDRLAHHRHALVERRLQRLQHVVVPGLADDAGGADTRLDQVAQRVVDVDLALHAPRRPERDEDARAQVQVGRRAPEELVVLRVRARISGLDEVDAEPVELLGDAQLVLDRERDPLELRPVAQRRVIDLDLLGRARWRSPLRDAGWERARSRARSARRCAAYGVPHLLTCSSQSL